MKKHELVRKTILAALADGKSAFEAELLAEVRHNVSVQSMAIPGGFSWRVCYCRHGNAISCAAKFACTTDGMTMPLPKTRPTQRKSWFDNFFYDFLEAMQ